MSHAEAKAITVDARRYNIYKFIHKALRLGHCRLLAALGSNDYRNAAETAGLFQNLRGMIALGRGHLEGENREIHRAIEARVPGASGHAADGHDHHEASFAELERLIAAVEAAPEARKDEVGHALYMRYAQFAADDLIHMNEEETELLHELHKAFTDAELMAIEGRIVAAIPPEKMTSAMKLMMPAMTPMERVAMLGKLKSVMPPQIFEAFLKGTIEPSLQPAEFAALGNAVGIRLAA
jgi:hypothetical protein